MTFELHILTAGCLLALVHIFAAVGAKTRQYGRAWNFGARDEIPEPPSPLVGRLDRAQANFLETFPVFTAAILIVSIAGSENILSRAGALLWLAMRLIYLPVYAAGVPKVRSAIFMTSVAAILAILVSPILAPD